MALNTSQTGTNSAYLRSTARNGRRDARQASGSAKRAEAEAKEAKGYLVRLYSKFNNDWTMNLVAMVSYNVLTSFFPLVLALITLLAFLPSVVGSPHEVAQQLNVILPANVRTQVNVEHLLKTVNSRSGLLSIVSIAGLLWGGSNVFGAIESAFAIIFRVKTRGFVSQKVMSVLMIVLFTLLLPLSFASTFLTSAATTTLGKILPAFLSGGYAVVLGFGTTLVSLFVLFLAIYTIVPNVPMHWRYAWRGALVAAIGMTIINNAFPYYAAHFLSTNQYGAAALATAIVTITWFWFFSLLVLAGAQINSLAMGIGYWKHDLTRVLMDQKVHTDGGVPTAIDALMLVDHDDALNSPLGVARDSVNVERHDESTADAGGTTAQASNKALRSRGTSEAQNRRTADTHKSAQGSSSIHAESDVTSPHQGGLRAKLPFLPGKKASSGDADKGNDKPHAAREMSSDLVATGIATGGVRMETEQEVVGPAPVFGGMVIAGVVLGLLRTVLGSRRRASK